MDQANVFLEGKFLEELNGRYAVKARQGQDLHRVVEAGVVLEEVLCVAESRVVGQDWCVRWRNRWLQIDARHTSLSLPRKQVLVKHRADGQVIVEQKGERLTFKELGSKPVAARLRKVIVNNRRWKPGASHPWNKESATVAAPRGSLASATPQRDFHAGKKRKAG